MAYQNDIENVNLKKLKRVEDLGNLETENATINGKHFTRVMLSFNTYDAASKALKEIKERSLGDAFIMRYENGKRTGKSR